MSKSLHRLTRRFAGALVASPVIASGLAPSPFSHPAFAEVEAVEEPPGPPPAALTAEDRTPVLAEFEEDGVRDPEEAVPVELATSDEAEEIAEKAEPLPAEGGPHFDVFATGPNSAEHLALVYPHDVNYLAADGKWKDFDEALTKDATGWSNDALTATTHFPDTLGPSSPVSFQIEQGSLATVPVGVLAGTIASRSGSTPDALGRRGRCRDAPLQPRPAQPSSKRVASRG